MSDDIHVRLLTSDDEIMASFSVMRELRSDLRESEYLQLIRQMEAQNGLRLLGLFAGGAVVAVAGFRISRSLAWGRYLYVDDLVTAAACRSQGHGRRLLTWLEDCARREGCAQLHLDSGVQRHDAHRFYLRERMDITCFHFARRLPTG